LSDLEVFIGKALKDEAIENYYASLITQLENPVNCEAMKSSGSPFGRKLIRKKDHYSIYSSNLKILINYHARFRFNLLRILALA